MTIKIKVHPKSKQEKVVENKDETYDVYLHQPPTKGKANQAVIDIFAKYFKIKKNKITIVSGLKSRRKTIEIRSF